MEMFLFSALIRRASAGCYYPIAPMLLLLLLLWLDLRVPNYSGDLSISSDVLSALYGEYP